MASAHVRLRLTLSFCVRHHCSITCSCKMLPGCLADKETVDQHRAGGGRDRRERGRWKLLIGAICPLISRALTRKLPCGSIYPMKTAIEPQLDAGWFHMPHCAAASAAPGCCCCSTSCPTTGYLPHSRARQSLSASSSAREHPCRSLLQSAGAAAGAGGWVGGWVVRGCLYKRKHAWQRQGNEAGCRRAPMDQGPASKAGRAGQLHLGLPLFRRRRCGHAPAASVENLARARAHSLPAKG